MPLTFLQHLLLALTVGANRRTEDAADSLERDHLGNVDRPCEYVPPQAVPLSDGYRGMEKLTDPNWTDKTGATDGKHVLFYAYGKAFRGYKQIGAWKYNEDTMFIEFWYSKSHCMGICSDCCDGKGRNTPGWVSRKLNPSADHGAWGYNLVKKFFEGDSIDFGLLGGKGTLRKLGDRWRLEKDGKYLDHIYTCSKSSVALKWVDENGKEIDENAKSTKMDAQEKDGPRVGAETDDDQMVEDGPRVGAETDDDQMVEDGLETDEDQMDEEAPRQPDAGGANQPCDSASEELFDGHCYTTCGQLTDGFYPKRVGAGTCQRAGCAANEEYYDGKNGPLCYKKCSEMNPLLPFRYSSHRCCAKVKTKCTPWLDAERNGDTNSCKGYGVSGEERCPAKLDASKTDGDGVCSGFAVSTTHGCPYDPVRVSRKRSQRNKAKTVRAPLASAVVPVATCLLVVCGLSGAGWWIRSRRHSRDHHHGAA